MKNIVNIGIAVTILFLSSIAVAEIYYVRADGTADSKQAAYGPSNVPSACMNMTIFNAQQFLPGDTVYFSGLGGAFVGQGTVDGVAALMHIPSSGEAGRQILYSGIESEMPLIDVSSSMLSAAAIQVFNKDHIIISNINLKGSGGQAALNIRGMSGISGYGVKVDNVHVLSSYGASEGNHDCFSINDYSEVEFTHISATRCRPETEPFTGSHQAITGHGNSKYTVYSAVLSDSNYITVNTLNTIAYFNDIVASGFYVYGFSTGGNATAQSSVIVENSVIHANSGAPIFSNSSTTSKLAGLEIRNSDIYSVNSREGLVKGDIYLVGNNITIDDPNWYYRSTGGDIYLEENILRIINIGDALFQVDRPISGSLYLRRNVMNMDGLENHVLLRYRNDDKAGEVNHNIFENMNGIDHVFGVDGGAIGPVIFNNLFYNEVAGGSLVELEPYPNYSGIEYLTLINNIFYNQHSVLENSGGLPVYVDNNSYYHSQMLPDPNGLVGDPGLMNPGIDYRLRSDSSLINQGASVDAVTDMLGNPVQGVIDVGPLEYQPQRSETDDGSINSRPQDDELATVSSGGAIDWFFIVLMSVSGLTRYAQGVMSDLATA